MTRASDGHEPPWFQPAVGPAVDAAVIPAVNASIGAAVNAAMGPAIDATVDHAVNAAAAPTVNAALTVTIQAAITASIPEIVAQIGAMPVIANLQDSITQNTAAIQQISVHMLDLRVASARVRISLSAHSRFSVGIHSYTTCRQWPVPTIVRYRFKTASSHPK